MDPAALPGEASGAVSVLDAVRDDDGVVPGPGRWAMYICICRAVSSTTVRAVITEGARTVRQVADACGASTDCGRCVAHVRALLEEHHGPRSRGRLETSP